MCTGNKIFAPQKFYNFQIPIPNFQILIYKQGLPILSSLPANRCAQGAGRRARTSRYCGEIRGSNSSANWQISFFLDCPATCPPIAALKALAGGSWAMTGKKACLDCPVKPALGYDRGVGQ